MNPFARRWLSWLLTLATVSVIGMVLLPIARKYPESVHSLFALRPAWQRGLVCFAVSLLCVFILNKMLVPRLAHLRVALRHPPVWLAFGVAGLIVCAVDLSIGLGPDDFRASGLEWGLYGGGALIAVAAYRSLPGNKPRSSLSIDPIEDKSLDEVIQNWPALEQWLQKESPADLDLLGNRRVAQRLADYLATQRGTVGLVGPLGSGKTTIVNWLKQATERRHKPEPPQVWFCELSCWGFEDSTTAVHQILTRALDAVGQRADSCSIRHLPDIYRKTFSAGGDWIRNLADLSLGTADPMDHFRTLSEIVTSLNARLVVIVEDLERTNTSRFDRQEVLALLHRLKDLDGLSFILTADLNRSADIDFAKLCNHIEQLREIDEHKIAAIIQSVRRQCLTGFPNHRRLSAEDDPWSAARYMLLAQFDVISPPSAAARLLRTPRALKHALRRTCRAWQNLHGEVDFDDLLTVNILRHGASGAFEFLLRNWDQLHDDPRLGRPDRDHVAAISSRLKSEWQQVSLNLECDPRPAIALIEYLLPQSVEYLGEKRGVAGTPFRLQGIGHRRYWERITNEEIDPAQARDQVVLHDLYEWLTTRDSSATLIERMYEGGDYINVWDHYAPSTFSHEPAALLQLSGQVLTRLRTTYRSRSSIDDPPDAFIAIWRCANRVLKHGAESREWLEAQIREAMRYSLPLVLDLYYYWTSPTNGIVSMDDREQIRRLIGDLSKGQIRSGEDLVRISPPENQYDIYWLVYPPGDNGELSALRGVEHWQWLKPILLDALHRDTPRFAPKIAHLISERQQGQFPGQQLPRIVPERLLGLFGNSTVEVLGLLREARDYVEGTDRDFLDQILRSAPSSPREEGDGVIQERAAERKSERPN